MYANLPFCVTRVTGSGTKRTNKNTCRALVRMGQWGCLMHVQRCARQFAGATQRPLDRWETPLWERPTVLSRSPAGAPRRVTCRAYVLRPVNQLRTLVRFTDQMAAAGMRNGRSHSRSQMRIDTYFDVASLAVTLAQGRVSGPERGANPFTRSSLSGQRPAEHSSRRTLCGHGRNGPPPPAITHLHMA